MKILDRFSVANGILLICEDISTKKIKKFKKHLRRGKTVEILDSTEKLELIEIQYGKNRIGLLVRPFLKVKVA